jgi:hypothetical protein
MLDTIRLFITQKQANVSIVNYYIQRVSQEVKNLANRNDLPKELENTVVIPIVLDLLQDYVKSQEIVETGGLEISSIKEGDRTISYAKPDGTNANTGINSLRLQQQLNFYKQQIYTFRKLWRN